jgi:hypothetical protein
LAGSGGSIPAAARSGAERLTSRGAVNDFDEDAVVFVVSTMARIATAHHRTSASSR